MKKILLLALSMWFIAGAYTEAFAAKNNNQKNSNQTEEGDALDKEVNRQSKKASQIIRRKKSGKWIIWGQTYKLVDSTPICPYENKNREKTTAQPEWVGGDLIGWRDEYENTKNENDETFVQKLLNTTVEQQVQKAKKGTEDKNGNANPCVGGMKVETIKANDQITACYNKRYKKYQATRYVQVGGDVFTFGIGVPKGEDENEEIREQAFQALKKLSAKKITYKFKAEKKGMGNAKCKGNEKNSEQKNSKKK